MPSWTIVLSPTTPLLSIAQRIEARHGTLRSLNLYRSPPSAETQIHDFSLTISSFGWKSDARSILPSYTIYYDFIPTFRTALIMKEPITYIPSRAQTAPLNNGRSSSTSGRRLKELMIPDEKSVKVDPLLSNAASTSRSSVSSIDPSTIEIRRPSFTTTLAPNINIISVKETAEESKDKPKEEFKESNEVLEDSEEQLPADDPTLSAV
jgi:hypothetical protein